MGYQVTEVSVNTHTKLIVDTSNQYNTPLFNSILRFFYGEILVLGVSFLDNDNAAITDWVAGDEFELSIDVDFIHVSKPGTLDNPESGPVTSIEMTFDADPGTLSSTGHLQLRNENDEKETIAYTAVSGSGVSRTFTVSATLTYVYVAGDVCGVTDELMVYSDDTQVDIGGDWSGIDRANGKLSFRVDCGRYEFLRKLIANGLDANNELFVHFEIKRKPNGLNFWSVVCQDNVYTRNVVRDIEE